MSITPPSDEDRLSQIPALHLLQQMGWAYLPRDEALSLRGGRASEVLLTGVLKAHLPRINRIEYKGEDVPFSEANVSSAIEALRDVVFDGLVRTNEKIYDLLMLGKSLQQTVLGDQKSHPFRYIDWDEPANNVYHVAEEFEVERSGSKETRRPDLVLFVNGIPLGVIECKSPHGKDPIRQAISQHIRNQKDDEIPKLFFYAQILVATAVNDAKYGTVGTEESFWSRWRELEDAPTGRANLPVSRGGLDDRVNPPLTATHLHNETGLSPISSPGPRENMGRANLPVSRGGLEELINTPLTPPQITAMFESRAQYAREEFVAYGQRKREVTEQDRLLHAVCRPDRLLDLSRRFIVFDKGEKKIARYQQVFTVKNLLRRVMDRESNGARRGGVVWHTQGSGKSLTMVMLAKNLATEPGLHNARVVLVTDRVDLDDQIEETFHHCGLEPRRARTGAHLAEMLEAGRERVMTAVINKFEAVAGSRGVRIDDPNVFVLVDEGHRGQYGTIHAKMRKALPTACYIGFTGTPVMKKDKNTVDRFGGLIPPIYTIRDAVQDEAVVPLLYEGRMVPQEVNETAIDQWFEKITANLSPAQKADLKKKFASSDHIQRVDARIMAIAWDVSTHFRDNWKGTGFKAQLVAPWKHIALQYKKYLDEFGMVTSEVLISGPDEREGHTTTNEYDEDQRDTHKHRINLFWKAMMDRYGSEEAYNKQVINSFKHDDDPEIVIVCHKLLTGFDAKRNTVLYLDRDLKEHTLLQAIARVNRVHEGKNFGYVIDYRGVLTNLGRALELYDKLGDFDPEDLEGTLTDIADETKKLPQRHSDLWDVFKTIRNKYDREAYEQLLADEAQRARFYDRLREYQHTLKVALASAQFLEDTPEPRVEKYKKDAKFFRELRTSVQRRYSETIDMSEYEGRIEKLLDKHVGAGEVEQITSLVNIFDQEKFEEELEKAGGDAAMADTIASRMKKTIHERMEEDPAFYKRFSELIEETIEEFRRKRLQAAEYLKKMRELHERFLARSDDDELPPDIPRGTRAVPLFGQVRAVLDGGNGQAGASLDVLAELALGIDRAIADHEIVDWTTNPDVQNRMRIAMEDFLFEMQERRGFKLDFGQIDDILEKCLDIAKARYRP